MKKFLNFLSIVLISVVSCTSCILWRYTVENNNIALGINTLKSLYKFGSLKQFDKNIKIFESYVSKEVFNQMTANNSDRILRIYLKFNANPCYVNVIDATPAYIVYSLVSESIENNRCFLFAYKVKGNKIVDIKEAELFILPTSRGWEIDTNLLPPIELPFGGE